jgi:uncharacterized protein
MKTRFFYKKISTLLCFIIIAAFASGQISQDSLRIYNDTIAKHRTGKNIRLMYSESSPLNPEQLSSFKGLNYFPPDIKYLVEATLVRDSEPEVVFLATTTDRKPEYLKIGEVRFQIDSVEFRLTAYQNKKLLDVVQDEDNLFIPFLDGTSGKETYEGGRYIDCKIPDEGQTTLLDFNKAYNPYCAYNPRFSCVIPPPENRLPVRIEAGEKTWK